MGLFDDLPDAQTPQGSGAADQITGNLIARKGLFDDLPDAKPGYAEDVAKTVLPGVARGVASIVGLPRALDEFAGLAAAQPGRAYNKYFGSGKYEDTPAMKEGERLAAGATDLPTPFGDISLKQPSGSSIVHGVEKVFGPLYEPKTVPGQFADTVAQFAAGWPLTAGSAASRVAQIVVPALSSESLGQLTKGSWVETPARVLGGLVGAGGVAAVGRRSNPERMVASSVRNATAQQLDDVERLLADSARAGVPITRAEAMAQVAGGQTRLNDIQRVVEGQGGLRDFMAQRPGQVDAASRRVFDSVGPSTANPSMVGPQVGRTAEGLVNETRGIINQATDPLYKMAERVTIPPADMARLRNLPGWGEATNAIKSDPQLARYVRGMSEDSVGFANEVKKYLDQQGKNAAAPVNAQANMQRSAGYGADANAVRDAAMDASPWYRGALAQQADLRSRYLDPLLAGPIGKIAQRDITTQNAIEALFPRNPLPGSAQEIGSAVGALAAQSPKNAAQLVRAHIESVFNNATKELQGGANQFGGANFVAQLRGNAQQAENLQAAVTALRGGQTWTGVDRFLEILQATGQRQRPGSMTSFNNEILSEMKGAGVVRGAGQAATGGFAMLPKRVMEKFDQWNLGRNTDKLAQLLTDPSAASLFRSLAKVPPASHSAAALTARLLSIYEGNKTRSPAR